MNRAHDLARARLTPGLHQELDALTPGRISRSSLLDAPTHPILSGLIQRKAQDAAGVAQDAAFAVASAAAASGSPLPAELRARFESALGAELSSVRIHTGAESARASAAVGARAYTLGSDIHFAAGQFDPSSPAGQRLLAHEVAHTVQQRGGAPHPQNKLEVSSPGDALEQEADRAADAMVTGAPVALGAAGGAAGGTVYRQQDPSAGAAEGHSVPILGGSGSPSGRQLSSTDWTLQGFATDSDVLTAEHQQTITQIANDLNTNGLGYNGFVTITGHADSRGTEAHNQQLGQQRADRVRTSLIALLTNPQTAQQVRAYSTGESDNDRDGDVAEFRQVTVTVSRGTFPGHLLDPNQLPAPSLPGQTPQPGMPLISLDLPPNLRPRLDLPTDPPGPRRPTLPPNFWTLPSPRPASRNVLDQLIHEISVWLTGEFGREQIARMAARIAERLGMDRAEVERKLNEAMINGGEEGIKKALQALIESLAGPPSSPPASPYGPATQEVPTPPIITLPQIPIPGS